MKIERIDITNKIHLLVFNTQKEAASTFLRFEESYESPQFRGKFFSLKEFKKWYLKNSPESRQTGKFTYYSDWTAFNIPSYVFKPFYEGKFDPVSVKEKKVLKMFKNNSGAFYVIAVHRQTKNLRAVLNHEIAHALFGIDKAYRDEVSEMLTKFDIKLIKEEIESLGGYHEETLADEIQALIIDGSKEYKNLIPGILAENLKKLYRKYLKLNDIVLPDLQLENNVEPFLKPR